MMTPRLSGKSSVFSDPAAKYAHRSGRYRQKTADTLHQHRFSGSVVSYNPIDTPCLQRKICLFQHQILPKTFRHTGKLQPTIFRVRSHRLYHSRFITLPSLVFLCILLFVHLQLNIVLAHILPAHIIFSSCAGKRQIPPVTVHPALHKELLRVRRMPQKASKSKKARGLPYWRPSLHFRKSTAEDKAKAHLENSAPAGSYKNSRPQTECQKPDTKSRRARR